MNKILLQLFFLFVSFFSTQLCAQPDYYTPVYELITQKKYNEAILEAEKAGNLYLKKKDTKMYFYCYALLFKTLMELKQEKDFLQYETELNQHYKREEYAIIARKNLGNAHKLAGNQEEALEILLSASAEAKQLRPKKDYTGLCSGINNDIAIYYNDMGDFEQALPYLLLSLADLLSAKEKDKLEIKKRYVNLSYAYQEKKDYKNGLICIHKAQAFVEKSSQKDIYIELINIHLELGANDSANFYLQKLRPFIREIQGQEKGRCLKFEGEVAFADGNYVAARRYVQQSIPLREGHNEGLLHSYILLGKIFYKQNKLDSAQIAFSQALQYCTFAKKNIPSSAEIIFKKEAIQLLNRMMQVYADKQQYEQVIALCDRADSLINDLRESFQTESAKFFLSENGKDLYEKGIEAAYTLHKIDKAFYYSEKCKAVLLFAKLREDYALKSLSKVMQDSLQLLQKRKYITENELKQGGNEAAYIAVNETYSRFLTYIEKKYPNYKKDKQKYICTLEEIQHNLLENQLMIAYFWGKEQQYCFVIDNKKAAIFTIKAAKESIEKLLTAIASRKTKEFDTEAKSLYKQLLPPILQQNTTLRWMIIPDGSLLNLPFEVLKNGEKYLVENHAVSYSYSATLWANKMQIIESKQDIVIAPPYQAYQKHQSQLEDLQEAIFLQNVPTATQWKSNKQDLLKAFSAETVNDYHFIYCYTHSFSDSVPRLVLADSLLSLNEIYTLHIPADLWILASCESGLGKYQEGEGVMSLARGFIHAGCRSVLPTLWKADAESMRSILKYFDQYSKEGYAKDIALQKAKIAYLAENENEAEKQGPDLWAMQVLIGDAGECTHARFSISSILLIVLVMSLLISFLYIKLRI